MDILTLAIAKNKFGSANETITTENITNALGYKPANQEEINKLSEEIGDLSKLSAYGSNITDIILKLISGGTITPDEEGTLKSALPYVYLTGDLTGISADVYVNVTCNYVDETNNMEFTDYAEIAWQGSSSLNYTNVESGVDKAKNYKIKLYTDESRETKSNRAFKDWFATNNYHIKANYGDCTNFMNNMMMHFLTKSYQYLTPLPREGARYTVDGFPVLLYINDVFCGVRFWNLKQDDKVYNLTEDTDLCYQIGLNNGSSKGDNSGAFVYGNLNTGSNSGKNFADAHAEIDYYWEDRVWEKTSNHPSVLYDTIQWVSEATDEEFKANLEQYFDKEYLIHYFVIMYSLGMGDSICKNFNMLYFPEKAKWYATFWDMDFACGTSWSLETVPYTVDVLSSTYGRSRLFTKLWANFTDECKQWYWKLRESFLTVDNIMDSINAVWGNVSSEWIEQNKVAKYGSSNTSFKTDGVSYVKTWVTNRLAYMDTVMVIEEDPLNITAVQGNASITGNTDNNRVTFLLKDVRLPVRGKLNVKASNDCTVYGFYGVQVTSDTDAGSYPSNNKINIKIVSDAGADVDSSVFTVNGMTWNTDKDMLVNWSYDYGITFSHYAIIVKKTDEGAITPEEALEAVSISGHKAL